MIPISTRPIINHFLLSSPNLRAQFKGDNPATSVSTPTRPTDTLREFSSAFNTAFQIQAARDESIALKKRVKAQKGTITALKEQNRQLGWMLSDLKVRMERTAYILSGQAQTIDRLEAENHKLSNRNWALSDQNRTLESRKPCVVLQDCKPKGRAENKNLDIRTAVLQLNHHKKLDKKA